MQHNITFIGAGNMAYSIIVGMINKGFEPHQITATARSTASLEKVAALGVNVTTDNTNAVATADVVFMAVKPQMMKAVLAPIQNALALKKPLLISVAAGITIDTLKAWSGLQQIVRCMPNTPSQLGLGATGLFASAECSQQQKAFTKTALDAVGISLWLNNEDEINAVTAVSGSGPAYFFLLIEAMQAAGQAQGLSEATAKQLAVQTALGAASMAAHNTDSPTELRQKVTSPGGTTDRAITTFNEGGFHDLVAKAMLACADHGKVLAKQLGDH